MERDTGSNKGTQQENKPYTDVLQGSGLSFFHLPEWKRSLISQVQFLISGVWGKDSHRD